MDIVRQHLKDEAEEQSRLASTCGAMDPSGCGMNYGAKEGNYQTNHYFEMFQLRCRLSKLHMTIWSEVQALHTVVLIDQLPT